MCQSIPGGAACFRDSCSAASIIRIGGPLSRFQVSSRLRVRVNPRPISDAEIAWIKMIMAAQLPAKPWAFSRVGQRVCIWRGPLAGLEGILLRKHDDFQVVVGVEALQRSVAVEINHEMVRAVEGAPHAQRARLFMTA